MVDVLMDKPHAKVPRGIPPGVASTRLRRLRGVPAAGDAEGGLLPPVGSSPRRPPGQAAAANKAAALAAALRPTGGAPPHRRGGGPEGAAHRRERQQRAQDRLLLRLRAAAERLAAHHSAQPAMAREGKGRGSGGRGGKGHAQEGGQASSSKADQRAQKVIDSVAACTLDEATSHPKWQAPPADRAGIQKFLSSADQRPRKLGDLVVAKQAAGDSTKEQLMEISVIKYQKLVTRRPNDQLQVLSKRRKAVKLEVIALEAKTNELRDDLKAKQQELRQLESNIADVRAVLADGGAADDEGDWDTDGFGLAPSWDAFHKAVIDRRLHSEAPGDGFPAWPAGVVGRSPRSRASSAGSATRGFADQVAKANAERAHQQQRHAEAEQEFAAELAEVRRVAREQALRHNGEQAKLRLALKEESEQLQRITAAESAAQQQQQQHKALRHEIKKQHAEQLEFATQMEARIISHDTAFSQAKAEAEAATQRANHLHEQLEQVRAEHREQPQPQDRVYQDLLRARAEAQEALRRAQHESAQATATAGTLKQQLTRQELVMEEKFQEAKKNHALELEAAAESARVQAIAQAQVVANAKGKGALPPAEAARQLKPAYTLQQYSKLEAGAAQRAVHVAYHEAAELRSANEERQIPHEVQALQFALLRTRAEEEEIAKASLKDKEAMRAELEGSAERIRSSLTRQVMIEEANAHDLQLHTESLRQELSSYAVQLSEQRSNAEVQEQALEEELAQALTFRIASVEGASAMEDFASQQRTGREEAIHLALQESLQRSSTLHTELDAIAKKEQQGASETEELKLRMQSLEAIAASRERERKAMVNLYAEMRQYGQEGYDFTKRAAHHLVQGGHLPTSQESMGDYQEAADLYEKARGAAEAATATAESPAATNLQTGAAEERPASRGRRQSSSSPRRPASTRSARPAARQTDEGDVPLIERDRSRNPDRPDPHEEAERYEREQDELRRQDAEEKAQWEAVQMEEELESVVRDHEAKEIQRRYYEEAPLTQFGTAGTQDSRAEDDGSEHAPMTYPASWPPWSQDHPTPEEGEEMRGITQHEADTDLASTSRASSVPAEQGDPPTPTASQVIFIPASPAPLSERSPTPTVPFGHDEQRGHGGGEGADSFVLTPPPASQQNAEAAAASIERQCEGIDIMTRQHTSAAAAAAALEEAFGPAPAFPGEDISQAHKGQRVDSGEYSQESRVPRGHNSKQMCYRNWHWQWEGHSQSQQPASTAVSVTWVSRGQRDTTTADTRAARRVSRGASVSPPAIRVHEIENVEGAFLDGQNSAGSEAEDGMEQCYEGMGLAPGNDIEYSPEYVNAERARRGRVNVCDDVDTTTLHNMARMALEMCPSRELPTRRTHIYTDGSYNGIPHTAAWAVVIVDEYDDGRNSRGPFGFRGFIAGKVTETLDDMANNEKVTAYTAELTAVLWALMWALGQDTDAPIEITPDALNVINLAKGEAQCRVHPRSGAAIRTLAGLLQRARPTQWHHINSHIGHPWNELADGIADQASASDLMDPNIAAVQAIAHNKFLSWEWLRSEPDAVKAAYPPLRNKDFIIEATQPQAAPGAIQRPISTTTIKADLNVNLYTYNCRSLKAAVSFKSGKGKAAGKSKQSLSKVTHLAAQFADMGLHVVALQETQSEGDVRNVGEYVCYSSGHTQQNRGCDIWLNVSQPISASGTAKYLSAKDTLVLHQHDRLLIIKTRVAGIDMVIASAYAPHEDSHAAEKRDFWESAQRLSAKYRVDIFMGDLNGRLGDCESPGVGTSGYPEATNGNGKHIISFAADANMEVINTTRDPGNNSYTHVGSKGQHHRIDYILLSSSIAPYVASCSTEPGLGRGTAAQDHIPVLATLKWAVCKTTKASGPRPDLTNLNNDVAKASFKEILKQASIIPWEVDVNTHCEEVTRVVNDAAIQAFGKAVKATRKPYVTKTTMGLIRARRLALRVHRAVLRGEAHDDRPGRLVAHAHSLRAGEVGDSLSLWSRERGDDGGTIHDIHHYAHLLLNWTISPMVYAMAILSFLTRSGPIVAAAVEKDRSAFLSRLASTASSASAANDAAAQWKAYRDLLRYGGRKAKFPAGKPMRLDKDGEVIHNSQDMADQEFNHFAKIQAGKIVTADDLANKYNHDSKIRPFDGMLDLSTVMPMAVCQAQFAAAKAGAQGGPDGLTNAVLRAAPTEAARLLHPLFTKVATTVREPLSFKGGDLVAIPKGKGDPRYLQAYREILLNNVLGKHHHKYLRTMLNTTLAIALEDIQVGGRPKRGADMAVLAARLFTERSQAQGKCSMISCYDLKEAFYSVVVQLVHGIPGEEDEVKEVLENLEVPLWAQPQLEHLMANPGILDTVLDGSHLAALIAEGYRNRWTSHRFSQNLMAPHKGTRPGVPLADADFNLLFGRVHRMIDSYLAQRGLRARASAACAARRQQQYKHQPSELCAGHSRRAERARGGAVGAASGGTAAERASSAGFQVDRLAAATRGRAWNHGLGPRSQGMLRPAHANGARTKWKKLAWAPPKTRTYKDPNTKAWATALRWAKHLGKCRQFLTKEVAGLQECAAMCELTPNQHVKLLRALADASNFMIKVGMLFVLTFRALKRLNQIAPCVTPRALVDDVSLQLVATTPDTLPQLEKAVRIFKYDAQVLGLNTQPKKSGIVAASGRSKRLFRHGAAQLKLQFRPWMRNLGHELAGGKVLRLQEKARLKSLKQRRRKYMALRSAVGRKASLLFRTGALPAAGHGGGVSGVSDVSLRYFRQLASTLAGGKKHGGVTAYLLAHRDPYYDPIFDCTLSICLRYAAWIWDSRVCLGRAQRAWAQLRLYFDDNPTWQIAKGPMSACWLSLHRIGWAMTSAHTFLSDTNITINLVTTCPYDVKLYMIEGIQRLLGLAGQLSN
ncbi:unnamed protein product [Prorocentrum cordatum]|uniref:RNase H type-1 domain-containing protein n=2 Tax=Prorocentrum cordatum TaxID=2364126 RepID=A0ABN9XYR1_9DINO|nr:unnamed protein product [Polarella glacialis]